MWNSTRETGRADASASEVQTLWPERLVERGQGDAGRHPLGDRVGLVAELRGTQPVLARAVEDADADVARGTVRVRDIGVLAHALGPQHVDGRAGAHHAPVLQIAADRNLHPAQEILIGLEMQLDRVVDRSARTGVGDGLLVATFDGARLEQRHLTTVERFAAQAARAARTAPRRRANR